MICRPPALLVSDDSGRIFDVPSLRMTGMSLDRVIVPGPGDTCALTDAGSLFHLPGRIPVGADPASGEIVEVPEYDGRRVWAVAAMAAPGHAQILRAAYRSSPDAPRLPLYGYTAAGWSHGRFVVAALRVDADRRHDLSRFSCRHIQAEARTIRARFPRNRLVRHLVDNCVNRYQCPTATSFVLGKCECAVPVSPGCNAACLGCISHQAAASGVTASHHRLSFAPTATEIAEYAAPHLATVRSAVVSFGQGCEGEPLLAVDVVEEALRLIRGHTRRGVINMNSNGSIPEAVQRLCRAGLDSIRISLNSAQPKMYEAYYRPKEFGFRDVLRSLRIARDLGVWTSINYLVFPGFTDHPREIEALDTIVRRIGVDMIQLRTLNIDPEWYVDELGLTRLRGRAVGMRAWVAGMMRSHPHVRIGCFNPSRETMQRHRTTVP